MKRLVYILLTIVLLAFVGCAKEEAKPGKLVIRYFVSSDVDVKMEYDTLDNFEVYAPTKEGYNLQGWYLDEEYSEKLIVEDLELPTGTQDNIILAYAKWTVQRFTVRFKCNDKVVSTQSVEYGKDAKEPTATIRSGYVFKSWDKEFTNVKSDLEINAIYEVNSNCTNILVVLGNRMNDNGTITNTMKIRLDLTILANAQFNPAYIVVSGGLANPTAGITEAQAMYDYLVAHGVDKNKIIKEEQSLSTSQNATYSIKKLENMEFNNIIIISTLEHFTGYNTIRFFDDAITNNDKLKNKGINIMIYTNS